MSPASRGAIRRLGPSCRSTPHGVKQFTTSEREYMRACGFGDSE